jgi:hypothetical protein
MRQGLYSGGMARLAGVSMHKRALLLYGNCAAISIYGSSEPQRGSSVVPVILPTLNGTVRKGDLGLSTLDDPRGQPLR